MKADILTLKALFQKPVRYVIPTFQRPYVWNQRNSGAKGFSHISVNASYSVVFYDMEQLLGFTAREVLLYRLGEIDC